MNTILHKDNQKIIGSIIKLERLKQNISQKTLAKGICVPSYLSRIENGEFLPSDDVISIIFEKLGIEYNDSSEFLETGSKTLSLFFDKLSFNEFDLTTSLFSELEKNENEFIASPLIVEYFLAKLARYCSTPSREKFESSSLFLLSSSDLLSEKQKSLYNFYMGVDVLSLSIDPKPGKEYIKKSLNYRKTGHCYYWLSYAYMLENNAIKAYDSIKRALEIYLQDGNIISIMNSYEKIAEVHFLLDNYIDAINYLEKSLRISNTLNNKHFTEHIHTLLSWSYYKLKNYNKALEYLDLNTGIADHRLLIPDSILKGLIYFETNDKISLQDTLETIKNPQTLEQMSPSLIDLFTDFFTLFIDDENYLKTNKCEKLLLSLTDKTTKFIELKKVMTSLLKDYYIQNRRYKDALNLI
ncbi:MAG: helix-turn-helix domain-containing protein [Clostridium sp.]